MNKLKSTVMDKFKLYFKNHTEEIAMVLYSMTPSAGNWAYLPQITKKRSNLQ